MKKMLLAVSLAFAATAAQADITSGAFTLTSSTDQAFGAGSVMGAWGPIGGVNYTDGNFGFLTVAGPKTVVYTFLGKEASFSNVLLNNGSIVMNDAVVGSTTSVANVSGGVDFGFATTTAGGTPVSTINNGEANNSIVGIMYFDASAYNAENNTNFSFLIGFNDFATGDADFDDYVIGVQAVPVPAALPLMASALGMFGIARRRKSV